MNPESSWICWLQQSLPEQVLLLLRRPPVQMRMVSELDVKIQPKDRLQVVRANLTPVHCVAIAAAAAPA